MPSIQEATAFIIGGKDTTEGIDFSDLHAPKNLTPQELKKWYNESPKTRETVKNML